MPCHAAMLCRVFVSSQVGVTCNFNDVHNSRVEVQPDRAYLKQQLKAVEARVLAIQEKKRKLDQRMSVLTNGLKVCGTRGRVDVCVRVYRCLECALCVRDLHASMPCEGKLWQSCAPSCSR